MQGTAVQGASVLLSGGQLAGMRFPTSRWLSWRSAQGCAVSWNSSIVWCAVTVTAHICSWQPLRRCDLHVVSPAARLALCQDACWHHLSVQWRVDGRRVCVCADYTQCVIRTSAAQHALFSTEITVTKTHRYILVHIHIHVSISVHVSCICCCQP